MSLTPSSRSSPAHDESDAPTVPAGTCIFPASFAQQRLWFLEQMQPGVPTYNVPSAVRLVGPLHRAALEETLAEIVRRHEALRTTFACVEGDVVQIVAPTLRITPDWVDLSALPVEERERAARHHLEAEARRPFNLERDPLFRSTLVRLDVEEHLLLLCLHHIVTDGWSMGVLYREMGTLYEAFSAGHRGALLPELPIQYADFAVWQQAWPQAAVLEEQLAYWKQQLAGAPAHLDLLTDRPRPALQTFAGASYSLVLDASHTAALKTLSREASVTLFMTLLAAWQTLLMRYTGQDDIVVGTPIANRNRAEIEGLIGFFVNTLPVRSDLSGDPPFRELLTRVREVALDAYAHQDLPFERLVAEVQPARDTSRPPLFQAMFVLQNAPRVPLELRGLAVSAVRTASDTTKFDLTLSLTDRDGKLQGTLGYNTDLFDQTTIERMAGHFRTLLEGIVAEPDERLSRLPLLAEAERRELLVEWNATEREYPRERCLHHLFEEQVARTPDAVAVVFGEQQLCYQELNARANQVAHHLQRLGVGPEVRVGICLERSVEMVVGLLGILKAGGAYVPLDPAYPRPRLAFMLADTQAPVLLTQPCFASLLPEYAGHLLCLDGAYDAGGAEDAPPLPSGATGDSLAYVIYTSGSTGQPKGVAVPHRGVLRLLLGVDYVHLDASESVLHMAPISFDASTFELWGPLLHGGRCVLFPDPVPTPRTIAKAIRAHGVTTLWLTSALFNTVLDEDPDALAGLRQLLVGGEALSVSHVRRALERLPATQLINGYGPTESTTFACCYRIPRSLPADLPSIPIGRPIANTRVYILDDAMEPVPVGAAGELYIGGDGLARGYLNRPELTREKFVPNPFLEEGSRVEGQGSRVEGQGSVTEPTSTLDPRPSTLDPRPLPPAPRLYRTGDQVRYLPDGNIEFLGRLDDQVKVRGFRVEPGEIEAVLGGHPAVRAVVVTARKDTAGEQRLVAYVVPASLVVGQSSLVAELRRLTREKLPEYAVPSAFVILDALPVTPNGKVDRRALPEPAELPAALPAGSSAPRDPVELRLAQIWEKLLDVAAVGVMDDFFELGGHSLMAVRLRAQIEAALGHSLPLATLFQATTIAQQADALRENGGPVADTSLVPFRPEGSHPPFFCVYPTLSDMRRFYALARWIGPEQPFYGLQIPDADGKLPERIRITETAARFIAEMRAVQPGGPYLLGGYCFGGLVAFEIARQLQAAGQPVSFLLVMDPSEPSNHRPGLIDAPHQALRGIRSRPEPARVLTRVVAKCRQRAQANLAWFSRNVRELAGLPHRDRFPYVLARVTSNLEWQGGRMIYRLYRICRPLLPRAYRMAIRDRLWRYTGLDALHDARQEYVLQRYPGRLTLFRAQQHQPRHDSGDFRTLWQEWSTGALEMHEIPGDHWSMFEEPHVRVMAETLMDCLHRTRSEGVEASVS